MPLRAKLLPQQPQTRGMMSATEAYEHFKPRDGDEPEDVLFNSLYGLRSIELNRPRKYNALNGSMIRKIAPRLIEWHKSDMANVIVMKGAGDKAFCAGGDVAQLAEWNKEGPEGQAKSVEYFAQEYQLDHMIATYQKPYVAFMDGITMGGGVGLSIHAPIRIATERTLFAMPETTIGFFPDVGGSFFLPRLPGSIGTYLALTSSRLKGVNAFYAGIATHYLHSTTLPQLESRLAELRFNDFDTLSQRLTLVNNTIEEYTTGLPHDEPMQLAGDVRRAIDRCFSHDSIEAIQEALEKETGDTQKWAQDTLATLNQRSPTAVHVTLRQMRIGRKWDIATTFQRELGIAAKFMAGHDFTEGVSAQLLEEKRRPANWQPASLADISEEDSKALTRDYFVMPPGQPRLELLNRGTFDEYPFAEKFGIPTEKQVEDKVARGLLNGKKLINQFLHERNNKQGVREIVEEILHRKTVGRGSTVLKWVYEETEEDPNEFVRPGVKM
ncbi:ClpP/crotonase-like domain-containing protein [Dichotomopilus funicola]|uniref:3-hydroxyisobutyryl-CoA hydrolase n=1 Tax=Dichotomopilus funicola TaxID=1934379 RepID=A0AAN6VDM0_9PEZI|nr:ClpP/crotonase-like domain-containing protein [Dichotomopilus funicola]